METMDELALRRQFEEAQRHALRDPIKAAIACIALQSIIDGTSEVEVRSRIGKKDHKPKIDLAEERHAAIEANFRVRGFGISVPKPDVSNTTYKRWRREGRELFYRPATAQMAYAMWMTSRGQGKHWIMANQANRAKVGWEDAAQGYWFTVEVAEACPRLNTSWNGLMVATKLLSLEEYVIAYWVHRDLTGVRLDVSTWCWLRTRYGLSALIASDCDGEVHVLGLVAADLSLPFGLAGGRAVEVVKNAA